MKRGRRIIVWVGGDSGVGGGGGSLLSRSCIVVFVAHVPGKAPVSRG